MKDLIDRIRGLSHPMEPICTGETPRVQIMGGIRAVLFDVYGTMLISGSGDVGTAAAIDSAVALEQALISAGYVLNSPILAGARGVELLEEAIRVSHETSRSDGIGWPEVDILKIWERVIRELHREGVINGGESNEALMALAVEYECRVNPVWPMPGLEAILGVLKKAGMHLGIVSNAQCYTPILFPGLLGVGLSELGFEEDLCVWSYLEGCGKPSDSLFKTVTTRLLDRHGILPAETLYVGNDMRNDIATARHAVCRTALFAGDARSLRWREGDPLCEGLEPDVVITQLSQLLRVCGIAE